MYLRILILIWLINPGFVEYLWWKMVLLSAIGVVMVIGVKSKHNHEDNSSVTTLQNPFELRPAMVFAIVFVGLSVITMLVKQMLGGTALLALSVITGVTDIDPFILSLVQQAGSVEKVFVSAILLAAMSNTIVKGVYFAFISKHLQKETALRFGIWALLHLPLVFFF
jgi:uncharacterized membrane protein (DUF4010 family)